MAPLSSYFTPSTITLPKPVMVPEADDSAVLGVDRLDPVAPVAPPESDEPPPQALSATARLVSTLAAPTLRMNLNTMHSKVVG